MTEGEARHSAPPGRILIALALLAALLRVYIHVLSPVIAADSAAYLYTAELMRDGTLAEALRLYGLHPLYPFLVSALGRATGDLAAAGFAISLAASVGTVAPLFILFRRSWSERVSLAAVALFALHPILAAETADALPTATHLCFFLAALACGFRALDGGPFLSFPMSGAFAALAYLTRTEGLLSGLLLAAAGAAALARPAPGAASRRRVAAGIASAALAAALLAAPYVAFVSRQAGRFAITAKGGGEVLLQAAQGRVATHDAWTENFAFLPTLRRKLFYAFFAPLLPFLVAGLVLERRDIRRRLGPLLLGAAALAPPILLFALNRHFRPSSRYFLTGVAILLPWSATAMLAALDTLRTRFPSTRIPAVAGAALLLALLLGKNLPPHRPEERGLREAGAWLTARPPAGPDRWTLLSSSDKLSWYAGARHEPFDWPRGDDPAGTLRERARSSRAALLALDERTLKELPAEAVDLLERAGFRAAEAPPSRPGEIGVRLFRPPP